MTLSSENPPELLSTTTTLVLPDLFFFLRTNMPRRYKYYLRHPNQEENRSYRYLQDRLAKFERKSDKVRKCCIAECNYIEEGAFENCHLLTEISLPKGIEEIGEYAFFDCNSLKTIHIPKLISVIQKCTFMGCESLETIELPSNITHINEHAFMDCKMLRNIVIPDNVVSIGYASFDGCTSLTHITLPETLNYINKFAFYQSPLETVICKAAFPPTIHPNTFRTNNTTLYILKPYYDLYLQSYWGKVFHEIIITNEDIP